MKFSIKDSFSKCDQTHLLKKSSIENFIFCADYQQLYKILANKFCDSKRTRTNDHLVCK